MDIIFVSKNQDHSGYTTIPSSLFFFFVIIFVSSLCISGIVGYLYYIEKEKKVRQVEKVFVEELLVAEKEQKQNIRDNFNLLANHIGRLQAHLLRLNALGNRLVTLAKLDESEFNFAQHPALGGLEHDAVDKMDQFTNILEQLRVYFEDREYQLQALEYLLADDKLKKIIIPLGKPVNNAWVSSGYGWRSDPFKKKRSLHKGIDFAGKKGETIVATGAGIVIWAGRWGSYGNLVEIDHGEGFTTRYAHNSKIFVKLGDQVVRGDKIAAMGSTGRSTSTHLHYEILFNGKQINPMKYIKKSIKISSL